MLACTACMQPALPSSRICGGPHCILHYKQHFAQLGPEGSFPVIATRLADKPWQRAVWPKSSSRPSCDYTSGGSRWLLGRAYRSPLPSSTRQDALVQQHIASQLLST